MRRWTANFGLFLLSILGSTVTSSAEAPTSTLDRISETGIVRVGYSTESSPFSYLDGDGKIVGYSIDLCARIADLLKERLGLSAINVAYVRRTPSDRVALLKSGDIDIECVASTNNADRRKSVSFSYPHFMTEVQFVALAANGLGVVADLEGRTVASTSGTTVIGELNAHSRERNLNVAVVPTPDHQTGFELMATGRVAAFVMDGILLSTMAANAEDPSLYLVSSDPLGPPQPYGLMLRHDDAPFKNAVNEALLQMYGTGEVREIYKRWFTMPIPPRGINLHLPMSGALEAVIDNPAADPWSN